MKIVNISEIPRRQHEVLGLVKGSIVRSAAKDIFARWHNFVGGEMKRYTAMLDKMRAAATNRMENNAEDLGADAVINVTYTSTHIMPGTIEIIAYGTAVRFIDKI